MTDGPPGAGLSSLAYNHQSVTSEDPQPEPDKHGCERMRGWSMLNLETGQVAPARCTRNACAYCLRANARRRARAIAWAAPERAVLLTLVGNDFGQIRNRMKVLRHRLAQEVEDVRWLWHVEPNPQGTGHHVHAWQTGSYVPQRLLSEKSRSVGMGSFARINKIRSRTGSSLYGLKGLTYGLKGIEANDEGETYLRENGYRLTHQSRGFFRSVDGATMKVRDAEKAANAVEGSGSWVLVRQDSDGLTTGPA